jgi:hypothetical protein
VLSATWFPENQRILATSIGAYANVLGVALGCFIPAFYMSDSDTREESIAHLKDMSLVLAVAATAIMVLALILIQDNKLNS